MYDIIVVGGGPAGLTAALYSRRANKSVLVIEKATFGGQITFSPKVENIPGFTEISGNEFAEKLVEQALYQGVEFEFAEVSSVTGGDVKTVTADGKDYQARAVIIATGAKHRTLNLPGEDRFIGNGISFCAVCDGAFFAGKKVIVVGGGNSALQEAILLADLAEKVYVVQNLDRLTGEKKLQEQLAAKSNVEVILGHTVDGYLGEEEFEGARLKSLATGNLSEINADGLFLAVGLVPQNEIFGGVIALDAYGYAMANENMSAGDGFFVAGDCRAKRIRQVATAASDGAVAALAACDYIDSKGL